MKETLIITVTEHRTLGYIFVPYLVTKKPPKDFYVLNRRLNSGDIEEDPERFSDAEQKIVKLTEEYSDTSLIKIFSRKKISPGDFHSQLTAEDIQNKIRPFIEKRIQKCIELIIAEQIPLYFKLLTGNIHQSDKITVEQEPASVVFNFHRHTEGIKYFLTIRHNEHEMSLTNKSGIIMVNAPCHLILENTMYIFRDIDGKKLLPFFNKSHIDIPAEKEKQYFEIFVKKAIKNYHVNSKGFNIITHSGHPASILSIENDLSGNPVLLLSFDYNTVKRHHAGTVTEPFVTLDIEEGEYIFHKTVRDYPFENSMHSAALKSGLKQRLGAYFVPKGTEKENTAPEEVRLNLIRWVANHKEKLVSAGFTIEQDFFTEKYSFLEPRLLVDFNVEIDWFDLKAVVHVGTFRIPFSKFRNHIIENKTEYLLPNGEIMILPKEWFSRFKEIFTYGKVMGESIQLKKMHFPALENISEEIDKHYLDKFKSLSEASEKNEITLPEGLNANLRPYQKTGLSWMYNLQEHHLGLCLADDMGLGKTLQTIALLKKSVNEYTGPSNVKKPVAEQLSLFDTTPLIASDENFPPASLIVLPSSLIHNWKNELQKFAPGLNVALHTGLDRFTNSEDFNQYHIILTTYGIVRNDTELLAGYEFFYLILDESQAIKNPDSKIYKAVNKLEARHRLVLTGTPIENSLSDLWAQLNFLNHGLLGNYNFFRKEFQIPIEKNNNEEQKDKLQKLIRPFILRRTKDQVAKDLPALTENTVFCDMAEEQLRLHEEEKSKIRNELLESIGQDQEEKSRFMLFQGLTRLRQIASHPDMIEGEGSMESGKFNEVTRNFENIRNEGHKVLIFSSFVKHLNLFAHYLDKEGLDYAMLTGQTRDRETQIRKFQEQKDTSFFLISIKAGGTGLNLTAADYVFLLDPWWNPAVENQAINRAHRIGQDKHVFVYRFISQNSIEEKILQLQQKKVKLAEAFISSNNPFKSLSTNEILSLFE